MQVEGDLGAHFGLSCFSPFGARVLSCLPINSRAGIGTQAVHSRGVSVAEKSQMKILCLPEHLFCSPDHSLCLSVQLREVRTACDMLETIRI